MPWSYEAKGGIVGDIKRRPQMAVLLIVTLAKWLRKKYRKN